MELRHHLDYQNLGNKNQKNQKMGWVFLHNGMLVIDILLIGGITYVWSILFFYDIDEWKFSFMNNDINVQIIFIFLTAIVSPLTFFLWLFRKCKNREHLAIIINLLIYTYFLIPIILNDYNLYYYFGDIDRNEILRLMS